jgi:hypothetical protein
MTNFGLGRKGMDMTKILKIVAGVVAVCVAISSLAFAQEEELDTTFGAGTGMVTFDNGGDGLDQQSNAVTVDSSGNIYVVGSTIVGGNSEFLTLKYDSAGNLLWSRTFYSGENDSGSEVASAVVVDDTTGDIYVAGGDPGGYNFAVIKYDSNGNRYGDGGGGNPVGATGFGNYDTDGGGKYDVALYWAWGSAYPQAMVRDDSGNLYVAGWEYNSNLWTLMIKLDSDGHQYGLSVDYNGVPVTTTVNEIPFGKGNGNSDAGDDKNDVAWFALSGYDAAYDIALDPSSDVLYLAGESDGYPIVLKYDLDGHRYGDGADPSAVSDTVYGMYDFDGGNGIEDGVLIDAYDGILWGIAADSSGNTLVAGYLDDGDTYWMVRKLNGNGYIYGYDMNGDWGIDNPNKDMAFGNDDSDGNGVNDAIIFDNGAGSNQARAIAVNDTEGFFVAAGFYVDGSGDTVVRTAKYAVSDGSELWSDTSFKTPEAPDYYQEFGISLGSIIVAATYDNGSDGDVRVLKYASPSAEPPASYNNDDSSFPPCFISTAAYGRSYSLGGTLLGFGDRILLMCPLILSALLLRLFAILFKRK